MPPIGRPHGNTDFSSLRLDISKVRDLSSKATHVVTDAIGSGTAEMCSCGTDLVELRRIHPTVAWISLSWPSASSDGQDDEQADEEKQEAAPAPVPEPSKEELLLTEIRDLLREQKNIRPKADAHAQSPTPIKMSDFLLRV